MTDEIKDDDPRMKGIGGTLLTSMMKDKFKKDDAAKKGKRPHDPARGAVEDKE